MDKFVGIGEYVISNDKKDMIKTFALGSCVAVTVYAPSRFVAGMVHIALPSPISLSKENNERPCYYAIMGVPLLINEMCYKFGCYKSELEVQLFGGSDSIRKNDVFNIGRRNIEAVREVLEGLGLNYKYTQVGGFQSRTIYMEVGTGNIKTMTQPLII
ncbi:chemotaxis protein CheD [Candidatus Clostridium stratigraminis]|uniref:Probable chemoreceptor glutamine deamidase CheD n=1 Tax=Candidatus Clostridium stratigraminis TaxID=3381661 RepID=A0ABW8T6G1_9CLOT